MLRALVTWVLVAVIVKLPVTTKLPTETFPRLWRPFIAVRFPFRVVSLLTTSVFVDVLENTFRSPAMLL
jgi:energy-converting hydrogenase Eha subunit A